MEWLQQEHNWFLIGLITLLAVGFIGLIIAYYKYGIKSVEDGEFLITYWFKSDLARVLPAGLAFLYSPVETVRELVKIKRYSENIKRSKEDDTANDFIVVCKASKTLTDALKALGLDQIQVLLINEEISINYELDFFDRFVYTELVDPDDPEQKTIDWKIEPITNSKDIKINREKVKTYFKLQNTSEEKGVDALFETLRDATMELVKFLMKDLDIEEARKFNDPKGWLKQRLQLVCDNPIDRRFLPVKITSVSINKPMSFVDPIIEEAYNSLSKTALEIKNEELEIELAKLVAKKKALEFNEIVEHLGLEGYTDKEIHAFFIQLKDKEIQLELAKNAQHTVIPGFENAIAAFTKGFKP